MGRFSRKVFFTLLPEATAGPLLTLWRFFCLEAERLPRVGTVACSGAEKANSSLAGYHAWKV